MLATLYPTSCLVCDQTVSQVDQILCVTCFHSLQVVDRSVALCQKCCRMLENEEEFCPNCKRSNVHFDRILPVVHCDIIPKILASKMKKANDHLAKLIATLMITTFDKDYDLICHIPKIPESRRLAKMVSHLAEIPYHTSKMRVKVNSNILMVLPFVENPYYINEASKRIRALLPNSIDVIAFSAVWL
ncbi:MAG: double zinc ribbon domain-containing protein [Rhabdochlamydiaceae bacterium]|nr:double zinc ribbon domain-containing protein [Candidatus Amphrikana amoebophyrae]